MARSDLPEVRGGLVDRILMVLLVVDHMVLQMVRMVMVLHGRHCLGSHDPARVKTIHNQRHTPYSFQYTDKKKTKIFLIFREIQMGSGAKSYVRYEEGLPNK